MKHILFSLLAAMVLFAPSVIAQTANDGEPEVSVVGAWNIVYTLGPTTAVTRQVKVIAYSDHTAKYLLGPRATTTTNAANAVWDDPPGGMFNISGEVRIPLGNVGFESGTLVFKALAGNANLLNCQVVYVQNVPFVASTAMYVIKTGTCVANPINPPTP